MEEEKFDFPFQEDEHIKSNVEKRSFCSRCRRPEKTCLCESFPNDRIKISTNVYILQHPRESETRLLTTVPLLCECLEENKCTVYSGRRYPYSKYKQLHDVSKKDGAILLFPTSDAIDIKDYVIERPSKDIFLIALDGTWREAKSIYHNCPFLHNIPKVKISGEWKSEFVIRTQPNNKSVSTLEAIAIALQYLENNPNIVEVFRKPLRALCNFQLQHGAQIHQSKEELSALGIKYKGSSIKYKHIC